MSAPATSALAMSPEYCRPPSPITGTPAGWQASDGLVDRGDLRHADPGDDAGRADRAGPDADLDAVRAGVDQRLGAGAGGDVAADDVDVRVSARLEPGRPCRARARAWPCAVSTTSTSTPASTSVRGPLPRVARRRRPRRRPRSRPSASLVACGYCSDLTKSLTVISPLSRPASSTSGSFSILCCGQQRAWRPRRRCRPAPVTSGIGVMTSRTGADAVRSRSACRGW